MHRHVARGDCRRVQSKVSSTKWSTNQRLAFTNTSHVIGLKCVVLRLLLRATAAAEEQAGQQSPSATRQNSVSLGAHLSRAWPN
jgi:hypothetical protein